MGPGWLIPLEVTAAIAGITYYLLGLKHLRLTNQHGHLREVSLSDYARALRDAYHGGPKKFRYGQFRNAIQLRFRLNDEAQDNRNLDSFLETPIRRPLLVVGEYGQGKTIACGRLAFCLTEEF